MTAAAKIENPYAGQGSVLLDIGGDVGALVVTMPAAMVDVEVEIRPTTRGAGHHHAEGGDPHHLHVAVVERPVRGAVVPSLVFPELVEGRYELYVKDTDDVRLRVQVVGGEVATTAWPG